MACTALPAAPGGYPRAPTASGNCRSGLSTAAAGRLRPVVTWTESRPAPEGASERARLREAKGESDVSDRAARILDVAQGEVAARLVDELQVGRFRLGELALQRA